MNFEEYQEKIAKYGDKFTANHTPGWELFLATGLAEEIGEVIALIRKAHRKGAEVDKRLLSEELGDVLCYLAYIAHRNGLLLEEIAQQNIDLKADTDHHVI